MSIPLAISWALTMFASSVEMIYATGFAAGFCSAIIQLATQVIFYPLHTYKLNYLNINWYSLIFCNVLFSFRFILAKSLIQQSGQAFVQVLKFSPKLAFSHLLRWELGLIGGSLRWYVQVPHWCYLLLLNTFQKLQVTFYTPIKKKKPSNHYNGFVAQKQISQESCLLSTQMSVEWRSKVVDAKKSWCHN